MGRRVIVLAVLLVAVVVGAAGAGAANTQNYTDPSGDSGPGADIVRVQVSNDYDGNITIVLEISNRTALTGDDFISIFFDADKNQSTGRFGIDYAIGVSTTAAFVVRGTSSGFETAPSTTLQVSLDRRTIIVNRSELGNTAGFYFFLFSDVGETPGDEAPDGDQVYDHTLKLTPVLESINARFSPAAPRAGRAFRVASARLRTDEDETLAPQRMTCTATLAGKRLRGTACRWVLRRNAAGKQLVVVITATCGTPQSASARTASGFAASRTFRSGQASVSGA